MLDNQPPQSRLSYRLSDGVQSYPFWVYAVDQRPQGKQVVYAYCRWNGSFQQPEFEPVYIGTAAKLDVPGDAMRDTAMLHGAFAILVCYDLTRAGINYHFAERTLIAAYQPELNGSKPVRPKLGSVSHR